VDLFAGSFVVALNYTGRIIKTANEINSEVTNFFSVLRDDTDRLIRAIQLTPCSVEEFNNSWKKADDPLEAARRYYVRVRMSYLGLGCQRENKGMFLAKSKVHAKGGETVSKWNNSPATLWKVAKIIKENFQITNFSYEVMIEKMDCPEVFFYCDPPYPKESRTSFNDYRFEFTDDDHRELADRLHKIEGLAMISSYDCPLMTDLYSDWRKVELAQKANNMRSKEVQECIWMNYPEPIVNNLFT
jgi:DNA adenine methylase